METLITLPQGLAGHLRTHSRRRSNLIKRFSAYLGPAQFCSDPTQQKLGSGGGTLHALWSSWRAARVRETFEDWLRGNQRVVLHAGGESRRLPAYAAIGKAFISVPRTQSSDPFDLVLADRQIPLYQRALDEAGSYSHVLVASGDVCVDFKPTTLPKIRSDIVGIGIETSVETATHFGVFFPEPGPLAQGLEKPISEFQQKPTAQYLRSHGRNPLVDTGLWLLSFGALQCLLARCGWNSRTQVFDTETGLPEPMDLYTEVGCALGQKGVLSPQLKTAGFTHLSRAVVYIENGRFLHLGSSRQFLEARGKLRRSADFVEGQIRFSSSHGGKSNRNFCDSCQTGTLPILAAATIATGLPAGSKIKSIGARQCVDVVPIGSDKFVFRAYQIDDSLRGASESATICGMPAASWFQTRRVPWAAVDMFECRIYPIVRAAEITQDLLDWFFARRPAERSTWAWKKSKRLSAREIPDRINFTRYFEQRDRCHDFQLQNLFEVFLRGENADFFNQDLEALAGFCRTTSSSLLGWVKKNKNKLLKTNASPLNKARLRLFLGLLEKRTRARSQLIENAFDGLRQSILEKRAQPRRSRPRRWALGLDDKVWARCPARIDLAGGWTDTPPYCLLYGGHVVNAAITLEGRPPVEVHVRRIKKLEIVLTSVDQGETETIRESDQLHDYQNSRGNFSLHKAALCLFGIPNEFGSNIARSNLRGKLHELGGGLEIISICRVPKGSGLGTSSILAATLTAALQTAAGLTWTKEAIFQRVLEIEQLITTGGGWQDQAGGVFPGVKSIRSAAGMRQGVEIKALPAGLLASAEDGGELALYYTGITRLAKVLLRKIIHGFTLGSSVQISAGRAIGENAEEMAEAIRLGNKAQFTRSLRRSWELNKQLDPDTSTPEIDRIIESCGSDLAACKLLGAGGGGFLLIQGKDRQATLRMKKKLVTFPLNPRARFVPFQLCKEGLQTSVLPLSKANEEAQSAQNTRKQTVN